MFLYYVPSGSAECLTVDGEKFLLDRLPPVLASVLADCQQITKHVVLNPVRNGSGPGGTSGVVIAPLSRHYGSPVDMIYLPAKQDWYPVGDPAKPDYWIGVNKSQVPTPNHLARFKSIPGYHVTDASGREWLIPVARALGQKYGALHQYYGIDYQTGEVVGTLQDDQLPIWELGNTVWDWYRRDFEAKSELSKDSTATDDPASAGAPTPVAPDFIELTKLAIKILGINYRVAGPELNALQKCSGGAIAQETVYAITQSFVGYELEFEYAKKKPDPEPSPALNGSPSTPGGPILAESPGTDQVIPPCGSPRDSIETSNGTNTTTT